MEYTGSANKNKNTRNKTEITYYQSSFGGRESVGLSSSLAVFRGRGANPPKKPQNSPVSGSAINFPSSTWKFRYRH